MVRGLGGGRSEKAAIKKQETLFICKPFLTDFKIRTHHIDDSIFFFNKQMRTCMFLRLKFFFSHKDAP